MINKLGETIKATYFYKLDKKILDQEAKINKKGSSNSKKNKDLDSDGFSGGGSNKIDAFMIDFEAERKKFQKSGEIAFVNKPYISPKKQSPCLVYLHSHSATRLEGLPLLDEIMPKFNLCVFDFSGCGKSTGEFVTLGIKEKGDLECVLKELESRFRCEHFFLWGRSMGAATAILFASDEKNLKYEIHGMILDSPFGRAKEMVM